MTTRKKITKNNAQLALPVEQIEQAGKAYLSQTSEGCWYESHFGRYIFVSVFLFYMN